MLNPRRSSSNDSGVSISGNEIHDGDIVAGDKQVHYHLPSKRSPLVVGDPAIPEITLPNDSKLKEKLLENAGFDEGFLEYARKRRVRAYKKTVEIETLQSGHWIIEKLKDELENLYMDHCHVPILGGTLGRDVYPDMTSHLQELVDAFPFDEFEGLSFDADYLRGLIFETTAECRLRWRKKVGLE